MLVISLFLSRDEISVRRFFCSDTVSIWVFQDNVSHILLQNGKIIYFHKIVFSDNPPIAFMVEF